jgi:cytochrome c5
MRRPLVVLAALVLAGCGAEPRQDPGIADARPGPDPAPAVEEEDYLAQWARSCALCHVRGEGGAPVVGDREAWAPRVAQGEDVLLEHTVEGLNNMPPLGYCMDCEEEDFRNIIRFMGGET